MLLVYKLLLSELVQICSLTLSKGISDQRALLLECNNETAKVRLANML